MSTVIFLVSRDAILDQYGNYVGYAGTNTTLTVSSAGVIGLSSVETAPTPGTQNGTVYIPILADNITMTLTREPTVLPIPVFGVSAAIDYNVRRHIITIEGIVLAGGVKGNSIGGGIGNSNFPITANNITMSGQKGWILDGVFFRAGDSSGVTGNTSLDKKEVQRSLFSRAVGISWTETASISPKIDRIIWGDPSFATTSFSNTSPVPTLTGMTDTGYAQFVWMNGIVTKTTIKEVGGEPTKYECTLEFQTVAFGGGASNPIRTAP